MDAVIKNRDTLKSSGQKRKKYRIVNKFRFIAFVVSVLLIVATICGFLINHADGADKKVYKEIIVSEGDTLWDLAKEYGSNNKDIRIIIYDICKVNDISADELMPGQRILIPEN